MIINRDPMFYHSPRAKLAGWWALRVFDMLVDISAIYNLGGKIPPEYQEALFLVNFFEVNGISDSVPRAIARLIEVGLIERLPGDDASIWIPNWEKIAGTGAKAPEVGRKKRGGGKYIYNTSIQDTSGDRDRGAGEEEGEGGGEKREGGTSPAMTLSRLKDFWNASVPPEIPRLYKISGGQREMLAKARLAEFSADEWKRLTEEIWASPFLRGTNNKGWKIDFDWVIQPGKMAKVLEGKYRGDQNQVASRELKPGESLYD